MVEWSHGGTMGAILMSKKERNRLEVLGWKERSGISLKVAAETMGVSYRQIGRASCRERVFSCV